MRKILMLTAGAFTLLALTGCTTSATPQPKPSATACAPSAPIAPATVKAGATLKVKGAAAACPVKFTTKGNLISLSLKDSSGAVIATSTVQAEQSGAYTATFAVPSLASGKATISLDSGFKQQCTPKCKPLTASTTIQKVARTK